MRRVIPVHPPVSLLGDDANSVFLSVLVLPQGLYPRVLPVPNSLDNQGITQKRQLFPGWVISRYLLVLRGFLFYS